MRNIVGIFRRDVKNIIKNPVALIVIIGIMILPSLYAWVNIGACWDPYGKTEGIQVAVANTDAGVSLEGLQVNVGDKVVENLKGNRQIGWVFMDEEEALAAVKSGKYFAAVVIPSDFSQKLASILTNDVQRAHIDYYVNEKKNAIAPKITDKGVSVLQQQINQTFVEATSEVLFSLIGKTDEALKSGNVIDHFRTTLWQAENDLTDYNDGIEAFIDGTQAIDALVAGMNATLPDADQFLTSTSKSVRSAQDLLRSSEDLSDQSVDSIEDLLDVTSASAGAIDDSVGDILALAGENADVAADTLGSLKDIVRQMVAVNKKVTDSLTDINAALPVPIEGLTQFIHGLQNVTTEEENLGELLSSAQRSLRSTGQISEELQKTLRNSATAVENSARSLQNTYGTFSKSLHTAIDDLYNGLDDTLYVLQDGSRGLKDIKNTLNTVSLVMASSRRALQNASAMITRTKEDISGLRQQLDDLTNGEFLTDLSKTLENSPTTIGDFMADPVDIQTNKLYPIANYGSAMTPFYSVLAVWVGALIMVAIVQCYVQEDAEYHDLKPYEIYFSRYLLFMVVGILQALIISFGDLYLLKIYCVNKAAFVCCSVLTGIVFSNIVYTLTLIFRDIGKAIAVVLLVLQVAGAGGTYPVEITPTFFKIINPVLPFTYGINCLRECVGGIYWPNFRLDILYLLLFLGLSLCVSLLFRQPLRRLMHAFEGKMKDSGIM